MYEKIIKLQHNEAPAKINLETGEFVEIKHKPNNIPEGKEVFSADERFSKNYIRAWEFLVDNLSATEIKIAIRMSNMAEMNTNSLAPLDDSVSIRGLADFFGIGTHTVVKTFKKLFNLGVYASFKYYHYRRGEVNEWIFNPYISFKGKLIDSDIKKLFDSTPVGKLFNKN